MKTEYLDLKLLGPPSFERRVIHDVNPVSGQVKPKRVIYIPNSSLRIIHARIIDNLRDHPIHGREMHTSPLSNLSPHLKHRYFFVVDLKDAYENVDMKRLAGILAGEYIDSPATDLEGFLIQYCASPSGGLATGFPASPDLFTIYLRHAVDADLRTYCEEHGVTYTHYLDDLTFSSDMPIGVKKRKAIREIIADAKFAVNHRKCKVIDLQTTRHVVINGVGIELGGRTYLPRATLTKIRGLLSAAKTKDISMSLVAGYMGLFWSALGKYRRRNLNRTEKRVIRDYIELKKIRKDRA